MTLLSLVSGRLFAYTSAGLLIALAGLALYTAALKAEVSSLQSAAAQSELASEKLAHDTSERYRTQEQEWSAQVNAIDQDLVHARQRAVTVDADLAAARLRLRSETACLSARVVPSPSASPRIDHGGAVSGETYGGAAVRIARESDAQLRACQATLRVERGLKP